MAENLWDVATYAGALASELHALVDIFPSVRTSHEA